MAGPRAFSRFTAGVAALALVAPLLAACGGDDDDADGGAKKATGTANLDFWGWAPGYEESVAAFNAAHPNIKVNFNKVPPGAKGGYDKMFSAVKAGNAPCLAQVGFESVPTFLAEGALQDVSGELKDEAGKFTPWSWNQVKFGEKVYGVPVDVAPMGLYYRKDVFTKFKIEVPKTWDEFKAAAEKLAKADSSYKLTNFAPSEAYWFAGLSWQNAAPWFGTEGDSWKVSMASQKNVQLAAYWQDLIKRKLVATDAGFSPAWFKKLASGKTATAIGAIWLNPIIAENAKGSKGKWAVAPLPQWQAGANAAGNEGGGATAVLKGCKNPAEAAQFASWMSTNETSLKNLIKKTGIYPAATAGQSLPDVNQPSEFYGGQNLSEVFKPAAQATDGSWRWGPTMTQTSTALGDAFGKAVTGKLTLEAALKSVQEKTLSDMKAKGMSASAG